MLTPPLCSASTNHLFVYFSSNKRKSLGLTWGKSCRSAVGSGTATSLYPLGEQSTPCSETSFPADLTLPLQQEAELEHTPSTMQSSHASSHALILPAALQPWGAHPHHTCALPAAALGVLASSQGQQHPLSVHFICPFLQWGPQPRVPYPLGRPGKHSLPGSTCCSNISLPPSPVMLLGSQSTHSVSCSAPSGISGLEAQRLFWPV